MTTYTDSKGIPITLTTKLGEGGEGVVFSTDRGGVVAKILHDHKLWEEPTRRAKIEWMIDHIPGEIHTAKTDTTPRITNISWPTSLVYRNGQFCGYLMPKITRSSELSIIINPSNRARQNLSPNTLDLYRLAHNVCTVYRVFHEKNYVVGDINTKNIMVTKNMHIAVVDCDSIQVCDENTNEVYPCKVGVPEYIPPELVGRKLADVVRTPNHDGFSIAVLVFQLLMQGHHPFSGIQMPNEPQADNVQFYNMQHGIFPYDPACQHRCKPPQRAPDYEAVIPAPIQALFRQAFLTNVRPTAAEWTVALKSVMDSFVTCVNDSTHQHPQGSSCTFCSWKSRVESAATGKLIIGQPKAGSKKQNTQGVNYAQLAPTTGTAQPAVPNPTPTPQIPHNQPVKMDWSGMLLGLLPFMVSVIALYYLRIDEQYSVLSHLYDQNFWLFVGAIAIFIGAFIRGVRTSEWDLSIGVSLISFAAVVLYGFIRVLSWIYFELLKLYAQNFGLFLFVIVVAILAVALIYALSTSDWESFGVIFFLSACVGLLYGVYWVLVFLLTHYFWWLIGGIVIALLSGAGLILKRRSAA
jgi:DNA-binding helix-hairpin-helix protein with protein kinase domain